MTENEITLLKSYLYKSKSYLEFGAGGTTLLADSIESIECVTSIESDEKFINFLKEKTKKTEFIHANIGKIGEWGYPEDKNPNKIWFNYPNSISKVGHFDAVLIDGRFRVACCLKVILKEPNSVVMIHDYTNRPEYHVLNNFLNIIERVDTLIVATIKKIEKSEVEDLIETYKYILD